ncbi:T9SS type A sorting domain-containing protein [Sporocytophaga myxococcoides]|uniref:T9SS type A sorting domain-containing protein n=1 Tax=Sporocytophaga myxococcoides TaxID=153721 RepID=UPI0004019DAA|nr:T9SS type A sorting domain-containing protein [Sporocytophaga myxococcoides]
MKKVLIWSVMLVITAILNSSVFGQCTGETYSIVNQCPNQSPQLTVSPVVSGTDYKWTVGGSQYGTGYDFTYQTVLSTPVTISYQKMVDQTGGPSAGASTPYPLPAGTTNLTSKYYVNVNSTTAFKLNSITVPVKIYSCDAAKTYRLKVLVGPTATPKSASIWYTFKCSDLIKTSDNQTFLVPMQVNESPTNPGLEIASGADTISVIYSDGTNPAGTSPIDGLVAFPTTSFNNSYTFGTTTITHSAITNRPAFLDWDITTMCNKVDVPVAPTASASCCVPGNVNIPSITSSTGSNIIDQVPVSPAVTLTATLQNGYYYQWFKDNLPLAAPAQNGNTLNITTPGQYVVRVAEKLADVAKTACYKSDLEIINKRVLFAQTNKDIICLGQTVNLNALGATGTTAGSIIWSGATGISDVNSKTPVFLPSGPGKYTLEVDAEVPVGNQVINGDFEMFTVGDASPGFTYSSYYKFIDPSSAVVGTPATFFGVNNRKGLTWLQNGSFSLYNYVLSNNDGYTGVKPCPDHTTGTGNLFFTDAAAKNMTGVPLTDSYMWSQQVSLVAGQVYEFAAWFTNANSEYCDCKDPFDNTDYLITDPSKPGQPRINFYVNDALVNPTPITIDGETCKWQKVSYKYTATTTGTATIKISEISRADAGNDFAMDDISFGSPGRQISSIDIEVQDCDDFDATAVCNSGTLTLNATSTNGYFSKWTHTTNAVVTNSATIANPNNSTTTAVPIADTKNYTAEFKFVRGNLVPNPDYTSSTKNGTNMSDRTNQVGNYGFNDGDYEVGKSPAIFSNTQDKIYIAVQDHTTGSATSYDYFSASGKYDASKSVVFSQTVTTTVGDDLGFSVWLANIHKEFTKATPDTLETSPYGVGAKTTKLDLYINNSFVKRFVLPLNTNWTNFGYTYKATSTSTTVELRVPNLTSNKPSAFAMDDIQLGKIETKIKDVTQVCALPVTYLYFNLKNNNGFNHLNWGTTQEKNADYFLVEKSTDGINFIPVSKINAHGNASGIFHYSFSDPVKAIGLYYRIKQVDFNGNFEYTKILFAETNGSDEDVLAVYPNPSSASFTIKTNIKVGETIHIKIIDTKGSEVTSFTHQGNESIVVGSDLLPGIYILEVFGEYQAWKKRIVKQ